MPYTNARYIASIGGHGVVRQQDIPHLKKGVQQIFDIMKDGNWYTIPQLRSMIQQEGADRRMRELRKVGIVVEKRRVNDSRLFEYRMDVPATEGRLF
jgi:hypothetical protein